MLCGAILHRAVLWQSFPEFSQTKSQSLYVTEHKECLIRVTVLEVRQGAGRGCERHGVQAGERGKGKTEEAFFNLQGGSWGWVLHLFHVLLACLSLQLPPLVTTHNFQLRGVWP